MLARLGGIRGLRRFRLAAAALQRLALVGTVAACAALTRFWVADAPPPATPEGVAEMLAASVGGSVLSDEFVWEPSRGPWFDALLGRDVLFLGVGREHDRRDLFRARVRVTREGRPVEVQYLRNLTNTPLGDERHLVARGRWVAFASHALGGVQGLTVLDLAGAELPPGDRTTRTKARIDHFLATGTLAGVGRQDVAFHKLPESVKLELQGDKLVMALAEPARAAALDLLTAELTTEGENEFDAWAWRTPPRDKPTPHFVMDALRTLFGTDAADTAKALLFDAKTRWVLFTEGEVPVPPPSTPPPPFEARDGSWPPKRVPPQFPNVQEGEGQWKKPPVPWLPAPRGMVGEPDPYLLETFIRPDPALPFATVTLVAIDTRQLELRIEAGFDEPRPLTGPAGRGRIPERDRPRLVAAFNGAFQTRHGEYGMVVDGRVLLPPKPGASSVMVDVNGRTSFGTWGKSDELPPTLVSLRQNLDPLIEDGVVNPRGRKEWGFPLEGGSYLTERSALCRTSDGYLIYGHGIEVDALTLARALHLAGCRDAMHLDMNPGHVGFVYHNAQAQPVQAALVASEMSIEPQRFVKASPKDFFYLLLREPTPQIGDAKWLPDPGAQPPPAWLPAVHSVSLERLGVEVTVLAVDTRRFRWDIRPGTDEKSARTADGSLEPAAHARAMIALGLGVALRKDNQRGLFLDGVEKLPIRADLGVLTAGPDGRLGLAVAVEPMAPLGDASELVLFAEAGQIRSETRKLSAPRDRSVACLLDEHTLLVAHGRSDNSEPMTKALLDLGCERVVSLNRGKQVRAFVHRAGTEGAPQAGYEDTALYGMAVTAAGTALRLETD